jgi:uncharacterized protein with ParB-like and HNH nuclease domain
MQASETSFQPIIEGTKQYVIPLFQRSYSWTNKEWQILWEDLTYLCENEEPKTHFIGSIVTMPTISVPEGVSKFLLIDGQQRLTTIFILLSLIRDMAESSNDKKLAEKINQTMLVNPFETDWDYFKLLPTQIDRKAFHNLIKKLSLEDKGQIYKCYNFFVTKFKKLESPDLFALSKVINSRLSVVSIVLSSDDNPHLVFESLNAKGRPLTQADLIRNYFFMRIHVDEQESRYSELWKPMQSALEDSLTEFIRHYLMREGNIVKKSDVYFILKDKVDKKNAIIELKKLLTFSEYYEKLINPTKESNDKIRSSLQELNRLEVTTAYPFLLNCYHEYSQGQITLEEFTSLLSILQHFVIRRFICNIPTNALNKIFPNLFKQAKLRNSRDLIKGVCVELQSKNYPRDEEFKNRLIESRLYGAGDRRQKTKLILEKIENTFNHKEKVDFKDLQVEHIMPQTHTKWWRDHLGEEWKNDHEVILHTLGNLTLTAYNPELSNSSFPDKRKQLSDSHLELNKYFNHCDEWKRADIEQRGKVLADLALSVWPYFGDLNISPLSEDDIKGQVPEHLIMLGQKYKVESWRDVLTNTLNTIFELDENEFKKIEIEFPKFINSNKEALRSVRQLNNGYYVEVNLSAKDIYRFCVQCLEITHLSLEDWEVKTK